MALKIFAVALVLVTSKFAGAAETNLRRAAVSQRNALMTPITPTFRGIQADLIANNITSSQAMLHLFATMPEYQPLLKSAVLERKSFALHSDQVTDEFPRIVMSSGNLTMHLTSDTTRKGDRLIEVVEYDPISTDLKFDLISFGSPTSVPEFYEKADNGFLPFDKIGQETGGAVFACSACHSSADDVGFNNLHWGPLDGLLRVYGTGVDRIEKDSDEYAAFQKFLAVKSDPVRGALFQELRLNIASDKDGNIIFPGQPNEKFTEHVYETARRKVAASLLKFSGYSNYQYALAGALMDCAGIDHFIPAESRTVHEQWLKKLISSTNINFEYTVDTKQLRRSDMPDAFWNDSASSKQQNISEGVFLANTTLPLIEALGVPLAQVNRGVATRMSTNFQGEGATDYLYAQQIYLDSTYISRMAKLRYLLFGYSPEVPADVFAPVNEVTQSGKGGFASISYRLLGANKYFASLLAKNFGPRFLQDNPKLNLFKSGVMSADALTVSVGQYCSLLKRKSVAAFVAKPLSKDAGGGTNGTLCGDRIGGCRYPYSCNDRGDRVKACTGGTVQTGAIGQLCAGTSGESIFFCAPETGCAARTDGILVCQPRPPGSGQIFEPCDPSHSAFCADGLVCHPVDKVCEKPQPLAQITTAVSGKGSNIDHISFGASQISQ